SAASSSSTAATSAASGSATTSTAARSIASCSTCSRPNTRTCHMPDTSTLAHQISALFAEKLHLQVPSLDTDLIDTGLVDSLTFVQFLAPLEQEFGVHVSLEDLEIDHFRTIHRIRRFVANKSQNGTSSAFDNDAAAASPG